MQKKSEVNSAFLANRPMFYLVYKESYLAPDDTNNSLPSFVVYLLQEFEDIFSEEMPNGLPPIEGLNIISTLCLELSFRTVLPIEAIQKKRKKFRGKWKI